MSAYIVDREHVAYLIDAAMSRRILGQGHSGGLRWWHGGESKFLPMSDYARAAEVAQMLWDENVNSVLHRYPDDDADNLPGTIDDAPYRYGRHHPSRWSTLEPAQVFKACHCYSYQACEHPGWEGSEAQAFIEALEGAAMRTTIGYSDAKWGAPPKASGVRLAVR